ncbi:pyridoxal-phosphate dependent enzyme [Microbacteriaceae bacterium]|nr:pyridoxal-phosphate dependent enzyme [Candidatus Saccharibacteria bacterium]
MPATLEYIDTTTTYGDEALSIIDAFRSTMDDRTVVEELDREFPYFAQYLELQGICLANLADNISGTFKWRGALVGALNLQETGATHLVAPSAGNHARGAVLAAKALGMKITVAVPSSAPHAKKEGIRELWNSSQLQIAVAGDTFDASLAWAKSQDGELLHPYDDTYVMSGQGTVLDDILRLKPNTTDIVAPVGGGGLSAGMVRRSQELGREDIIFHLAEAPGSNSTSQSLRLGRLATADMPNQRFGGSAVKQVGNLPFEVLSQSHNVNMVEVSEHDINLLSELYLDGRRDLLRQNTPNFEPTSLVAVAAMKQLIGKTGETVVLGTGRNDTVFPAASVKSRRLFI